MWATILQRILGLIWQIYMDVSYQEKMSLLTTVWINVACVASGSARVRQENWNESKKRNEGGGGGEWRNRLPANPTILTLLEWYTYVAMQPSARHFHLPSCLLASWSSAVCSTSILSPSALKTNFFTCSSQISINHLAWVSFWTDDSGNMRFGVSGNIKEVIIIFSLFFK